MNEHKVAEDVARLAQLLNGEARDKAVSHPTHYNMGGIEVIDAITAWGFGEGFNKGNAIKYIARAGRKDKTTEVQDLKKAIQYLEFEIERLQGGRNGQEASGG